MESAHGNGDWEARCCTELKEEGKCRKLRLATAVAHSSTDRLPIGELVGKAAPAPLAPGAWLQFRLMVEGEWGGTFPGHFAATTSNSLGNRVDSESNGLTTSLEFLCVCLIRCV